VHPRSIALLKREGILTEGYHSKSWDDLPAVPTIVITVCGNAANEVCPAYIGDAMRTHWGVDDPDAATGSEAEIEASFVHAYTILRKRIEAFLDLDIDTLNANHTLQTSLDKIGQLS